MRKDDEVFKKFCFVSFMDDFPTGEQATARQPRYIGRKDWRHPGQGQVGNDLNLEMCKLVRVARPAM